jgi:phosphate transport system protein
VHNSLDCLVTGDADLARRVLDKDADVDALNVEIINELAELIRANPEKVRPLLLLVSVSRNLERIADCATNIAEDVVYMVRGVIIRHRAGDSARFGQAENATP